MAIKIYVSKGQPANRTSTMKFEGAGIVELQQTFPIRMRAYRVAESNERVSMDTNEI